MPLKVITGRGLISARISGTSPKCFKRFGKMLAALMGGAKIVMHAVEADLQVRAAALTRLCPAGLAGQRVSRSALVTMARHKPLK